MTVASRTSFLLLAACVLSTAVCAAQGLPTSATGRFAVLDANGDGVVDKDEYNTDALLAAIDGNRNSRISADELRAMLGPQADGTLSAADRIRIADRNGDGELEYEELRRGAEMRFQQLDANRDDRVDEDEFRSRFGMP